MSNSYLTPPGVKIVQNHDSSARKHGQVGASGFMRSSGVQGEYCYRAYSEEGACLEGGDTVHS